MSIGLTNEQLEIVKGMTDFAKAVSDQIYHIMENHGLDKVNGFRFAITVDPAFETITKIIDIGSYCNIEDGKPAGYCRLTKGKDEMEFSPLGKNSAEYEWLFADEPLKSKMKEILDMNKEKPLPVDGFWVGKDYGEE